METGYPSTCSQIVMNFSDIYCMSLSVSVKELWFVTSPGVYLKSIPEVQSGVCGSEVIPGVKWVRLMIGQVAYWSKLSGTRTCMHVNNGALVNFHNLTDLAKAMMFTHLVTITGMSQKISELEIYPAEELLDFTCRMPDVLVVGQRQCDGAGNMLKIPPVHKFKLRKELFVAVEGTDIGQLEYCEARAELAIGNCKFLGKMSDGTVISSVNKKVADRVCFVRIPSTSCLIVDHYGGRRKTRIRLTLGSRKTLMSTCREDVDTVAGDGRMDKPVLKNGANFGKCKLKRFLLRSFFVA